jgi:ABC-type uncharacterized transport system permease subunit
MLVGLNAWMILPVALFFSALNIGSLQLPLNLSLESSLAGVIQGMLVLAALLGRGLSEVKAMEGIGNWFSSFKAREVVGGKGGRW